MPPPLLYPYLEYTYDPPSIPIEEIRKYNPQRGAMEHLTGIVHVDTETHGVVGYKEVTPEEFWVPGHMPDYPLMPGVIMCEAVAQLAGFYARKYKLLEGDFIGFGGMDEVRFRKPVLPGSRLILMVRAVLIKPRRRVEFEFQGMVRDHMVLSGKMIGVPISKESDGEE